MHASRDRIALWVIASIASCLSGLSSSVCQADEGMWPFNNLPRTELQQRYGFDVTDGWVEHVRRASVRVSTCSGSFVSGGGLTLTNHHCALDCLSRLSSRDQDYVSRGFYALDTAAELVCPGYSIQQLEQISDVTDRIARATQGHTGQAFERAQRGEVARIERACAVSEQVSCEVVSLYHGGRYELYAYRRYSDVRLVFAPERDVAFFGGDPDNFTFPRFDLDVTFLRAYVDGRPASTPDHLRWASAPLAPNDLTFVAGSPGSTERLRSVAELEFLRDHALVEQLLGLAQYRGFLEVYAERGSLARRAVEPELFHVENSFKELRGARAALNTPGFFRGLVQRERALRERVRENPAWQREYGGAWDAIARARERAESFAKDWLWVEGPSGFRPLWARTQLFIWARTLVRGATERLRENEQRLDEYGEARLPALEQRLLAARPLSPEFEAAKLAFGLRSLREALGFDHTFVKQVLGSASPEERASALVLGSRLGAVSERRRLWQGGLAAVQSSRDPMIQLALAIDREGRALRARRENELDAVMVQSSELIARARFAIYGTGVYPDATGSPRLSFGTVRGWREPRTGELVPAFTRLGGIFARATQRAPYALPTTWLAKRRLLELSTPFNFACDADIVGGNSGSPVLNRRGELVGLLFDGNLHSLGGAYGFDIATNRAVALDARAILHTLDVIYGARRLLAEIAAGPVSTP